MRRLPRRVLLVACGAIAPVAAFADPPAGRGGGHGRGQGAPPGQGHGNAGGAHGQGRGGPPAFGGNESAVIRDWKLANPGWTPRPLPPGQMRQLARGRPLPPGIARQALPPGLVQQLPVYPGHSYAMVGTSVVLLGAGGVVVDILGGLF